MGDESKYLNTTGDKTTVNSVIPNLEDATTVARVSTENSVKSISRT